MVQRSNLGAISFKMADPFYYSPNTLLNSFLLVAILYRLPFNKRASFHIQKVGNATFSSNQKNWNSMPKPLKKMIHNQ